MGTPLPVFPGWLSCAPKGPREGGGGPGAGSACNPAGKGSYLVIQSASGLAQTGNARARRAPVEQSGRRRAGGLQIPRGGEGRGRGGTLPSLGSAGDPLAPLESQPSLPLPLPHAFSGTGPRFQCPHRTRQTHSGSVHLSQTQMLWGWGQPFLASLCFFTPLASSCSRRSLQPRSWKPRPTRWQEPNLHPSAGSAHPAHGLPRPAQST